MLISETE